MLSAVVLVGFAATQSREAAPLESGMKVVIDGECKTGGQNGQI